MSYGAAHATVVSVTHARGVDNGVFSCVMCSSVLTVARVETHHSSSVVAAAKPMAERRPTTGTRTPVAALSAPI